VPTPALEYDVVARLRPGENVAQAQAELTAILRQKDKADRPGDADYLAYVARTFVAATPLPELAAADSRPGMLLLAALAAVVLLIACIDVVLLLLARLGEREREMAVRRALGASMVRLARQLFAETATLVAIGGSVSVGLAFALQPVLRAIIPAAVTRGDETSLDVPVLAFAVGLCILLTLVCGLAPLWHVSASGLHETLKQAFSNASASRRVTAWRRAVVAVQVAVALLLLVAATLLLQSFWHLRHVALGYEGTDVLTMEMRLMRGDATETRLRWFERELLDRIRVLPGVTDASMTTSVPMRGVDFLYVTGPVGGSPSPVNGRSVDGRYFDLMRIPLIAGRGFTDQHNEESAPVAIVSRSYARMLFGDRNPLGQRLDLIRTQPEIVGVVGDVRQASVKQPAAPALYLPRGQNPNPVVCLVVRTKADLIATATAVRKVIYALDPKQPVERIATLDGIVRETTADDRFYTVTTVSFAAIALLLAVAGLFGVVRRGVAERTRELAIRSALGAAPRTLIRLALAQEMRAVVLGASVGLLAAYWLSRLLPHFLFEVSPLDPLAYILATALLLVVAIVGCYLPARRVTRIDPIRALRAE
jgi:predicted permease